MFGDRSHVRVYLAFSGLILLLSMPARFAGLTKSVWLDEAWVANSVLAPGLRDTLFPTAWTQSSPPLFLVLERWMATLAGPSEAALRFLPIAAGVAGLAIAALAFWRWLPFPSALLAFTLLAGNYWIIRYGVSVKQYGTDFLFSALMLWLLARFLQPGSPRLHPAALAAIGSIGLLLSYTAVFWLPALVIFAAIPARDSADPRSPWSRIPWRAAAFLTLILLAVLAIEYVVFIRTSRSPELIRDFRSSYLDLTHPWASIQQMISTTGLLLVSIRGVAGSLAGAVAAALTILATVRAVRELRAGEMRGMFVLLAGVLPWASLLAAGALRLYPVLDYPRMLLFALPSAALLLGYAVDSLLPSSWRWAAAVFALLAVAGSQWIYFRFPRALEDNRPALEFVQSHLRPGELLYVHGGMYEQFKYYRMLLGFRPENVYVANTHWPCCATGDRKEAASPAVKDFAEDLLEAGRRANGTRLWVLIPAGEAGHWSGSFRGKIDAMPATLAPAGCTREVQTRFGLTLVESYACR